MKQKSGFTLIEISIVLVIIGLIVGGVLVGQDMISAAAVRAQISQIEKYNTAVHTFQSKYGYLPGDIPDPYASNFGFQARGSYAGQGDGNGILEGNSQNGSATHYGLVVAGGETAVFWEDLSKANLIDATISGHDTNGANYPCTNCWGATPTLTTTPGIKDWLPTAKIGQNNFVYDYSDSGTNYYGLSSVTSINIWSVLTTANQGITVQQAYAIDSKIDDGLPISGNVTACYINARLSTGYAIFASASFTNFCHNPQLEVSQAQANTTCFDNNGVFLAPMYYSISNNATAQNCALSFKFQ